MFSVYSAIEYALENIATESFYDVFKAEYEYVYIETLANSVLDYIIFFNVFKTKMYHDEYLSLPEIPSDMKNHSLRGWFIHKNEYLDAPSTLRDFIVSAKDFIVVYEAYSKKGDKLSFEQEKSLRNCERVINNLLKLSEDLYEISRKKERRTS